MTRPSFDALAERRDGHITNHEDVFGYFTEGSPTITEVATASGLSVSTVRRYVRDLTAAGYLVRDQSHLGHPTYTAVLIEEEETA